MELSLPLALPRPGRLLRRLMAMILVRRARRRLAALDDQRLTDVGLTREQARAEASRPLWDVPDHWLK